MKQTRESEVELELINWWRDIQATRFRRVWTLKKHRLPNKPRGSGYRGPWRAVIGTRSTGGNLGAERTTFPQQMRWFRLQPLWTNHLMMSLTDCHVINQLISIQHQILCSPPKKSSETGWVQYLIYRSITHFINIFIRLKQQLVMPKMCNVKYLVLKHNNHVRWGPLSWISENIITLLPLHG